MELIRENFSNLTEKINITISTKLVEKLFEQRVFTVEEMNCVLSEKTSHTAARTLIMMIILKGEESCNFFLQLLKTFDESLFRDVFGSTFCDRKETFESLIKGKAKRDKDAMSSITEEDIDELEAFLKRFYQSPYFQNFKPLGEETDIDIIFKLETTFTDPFLWKKDIYNHRKEKIKFEDVLWNIPSPCIIEGEAGILLDGLHKLFEIDKLILHNISMNEKDGEILANGISHLKKLEVLKLSVLPNIGSSMEHVVQSISHCDKMKELCLINCCLTSNTFIILSHNLKNFTNLEILDLSDNFLEDNGKQSVETFSQTLTHLTSLTTLLLPGGTDVKCGLDDLLYHLEGLPRLSKLAFRRWNLTDDDVIKLGAHFTKGFGQLSFLDLSFNCVDNNGWIFLMQALQNLKNLKYFDFSTEGTFSPIGDVVQTLCSLVKLLPCLSSLKLDNWELDNIDIGKMKNIKFTHRGGEAFEHFFLADKN